jgi:hypothetical protein
LYKKCALKMLMKSTPGLVVNVEDSWSEHWSFDVRSNPGFT